MYSAAAAAAGQTCRVTDTQVLRAATRNSVMVARRVTLLNNSLSGVIVIGFSRPVTTTVWRFWRTPLAPWIKLLSRRETCCSECCLITFLWHYFVSFVKCIRRSAYTIRLSLNKFPLEISQTAVRYVPPRPPGPTSSLRPRTRVQVAHAVGCLLWRPSYNMAVSGPVTAVSARMRMQMNEVWMNEPTISWRWKY